MINESVLGFTADAEVFFALLGGWTRTCGPFFATSACDRGDFNAGRMLDFAFSLGYGAAVDCSKISRRTMARDRKSVV